MPPDDPAAALLRLLAHPDVASKRTIFEQYDHMVGVRTVAPPGTGAAVLRIIEASPMGLALVADGNARWCATNPRAGAALVVLEAAANLACAGAEPVAVTDCLNFGNPERPEVFWTFREAVDGIADACRALDVPVIGGNVSFYNEAVANEAAILPTPIVGMVGIIDDVSRHTRPGFVREGDLVVLLGDGDASLEASLYRTEIERKAASAPQDPQVDRAARAIRCVRQAVRDGLLASAHDVSDGGTAVALAEACIQGQIGAAVLMPDEWFGEGSGRFVVSVEPGRLAALETLAKKHDVTLRVVGAVGGTSLYICGPAASAADASRPPAAGLAVSALTDAWNCLEV